MLQNISVRYDPAEDRLVLRLALKPGDETEEHSLHLTRRVCASLRLDLQAMVDMSAELPPAMDRAAKAAISAAYHQALSSQVPTRTEQATQPVEAQTTQPDLVLKAVCGRRRTDGRWVLKFELRGKSPLTLVLSNPTLHALVDALSRRVQLAGWQLPPMAVERQPADRNPGSPLH